VWVCVTQRERERETSRSNKTNKHTDNDANSSHQWESRELRNDDQKNPHYRDTDQRENTDRYFHRSMHCHSKQNMNTWRHQPYHKLSQAQVRDRDQHIDTIHLLPFDRENHTLEWHNSPLSMLYDRHKFDLHIHHVTNPYLCVCVSVCV